MSEIMAAVAKAAGAVRAIAKTARNNEQRYDFASVDDFLASLGPICADAGLVVLMNEIECEGFTREGKYGPTHWLRFVFEFIVGHASGQTLPPVRRSVEVIRTGAQSYGSAQSYALKQFLRALLMVPTGDKEDADYGEKGEGAVQRAAPRPAPPAKPDADAIAAEVRANTDAAALIHDIDQCADETALMTLWTAANRDTRRPLVSRSDVIAAKDRAKKRVMQPSPFAEAG